MCVEVPRLLNIIYEERFPIKWFNDSLVTINNNDKYDLSHCAVSSFIQQNTLSGLFKLYIILIKLTNFFLLNTAFILNIIYF